VVAPKPQNPKTPDCLKDFEINNIKK